MTLVDTTALARESYFRIARCIARAKPHMSGEVILDIAEAVCVEVESIIGVSTKPNYDDPHAFAKWAATQPSVMEHIQGARRIQAIKELRALTSCSLVQAKNATDLLPLGY